MNHAESGARRGCTRWSGVLRGAAAPVGGLLLVSACTVAEPQRIELLPLASGEWAVVGVPRGGAVLSQQRRSRHVQSPASSLRVLRDTLEGVAAETVQVATGRSRIELLRVGELYFSATSPPALSRSPVHPNRYVFEHDDAIWLLAAPDTVIKLTTDDDLVELRGRQREGEVILYWSVNPVWSADGRYVAFITNRESVRGGDATQAIWVIDLANRRQRPLVSQPHAAASIEGVLGDAFLFASNREPGVLAVNPGTGVVTRVNDGFVLGSHPRGVAAAIAVGEPDQRTVWIHRANEARPVSSPASGLVWSTQAQFSPDGDRLALLATDGAGAYRLYVVPARRGEPIAVDLPGGPSYGPVWVSETSLVFASSRPGEFARTWIAHLR